jgi:hypothetical protein
VATRSVVGDLPPVRDGKACTSKANGAVSEGWVATSLVVADGGLPGRRSEVSR